MDVFISFPWLIDVYVIVFGLILGSFASALAYRLPRQRAWLLEEIGEEAKPHNQSFWIGLKSRSRCTSCSATLGVLDLIPVFSYIFSAGKCRYCKKKITIKYPLIELATAFLFWLIYFQLGFSVTGILLMMGLPLMVASSVIDLDFLILPDELTVSMAFLGFVHLIYTQLFSGFSIDPIQNSLMYLACAVFYGGFGWALQKGFYKATGKEGLGWGDIKLFAVAGLWLGWSLMPFYLIVACFFGLVVGLIWRLVQKEALFPFGPALILSLYLLLLFGDFFSALI